MKIMGLRDSVFWWVNWQDFYTVHTMYVRIQLDVCQ
jgi:hypothetical protein